MNSRRSWLLGLAIGAFIGAGSIGTVQAQTGIPRFISYQGQLLNNGKPVANETHDVTVNYYTAGGGSPINTETFRNVSVKNGVFNILLGSALDSLKGFPLNMDFNQRYFIGVAIDAQHELPQTPLESVPYALNSERLGGIEVSTTPSDGKLFPLHLINGKIDPTLLPAATNSLSSINGVSPDSSNNISLVPSGNISITQNPGSHTITIGSGSAITGVFAGSGLVGGGTSGNILLAVAPGSVDNTMIAPGAVTGRSLDSRVAGLGLYQDQLGDLNVGVDNSTIEISPYNAGNQLRVKNGGINTAQLADSAVTNPKIRNGAVNASKVDSSQVQLRVIGSAPAGSFIRSINSNGTIDSGTVTSADSSLTRTVMGNNANLAINPAHTNTFTARQNFNGGIGATDTADGNGQTLLTAQNRFADVYALSPTDKTANTITINNTFVQPNSTVVITAEKPSGPTPVGMMNVSMVGANSFTVTTTAATFGGVAADAVQKIHYTVINH